MILGLLQRFLLRLFNASFDLDVDAELDRIEACRKAML